MRICVGYSGVFGEGSAIRLDGDDALRLGTAIGAQELLIPRFGLVR